MRLRIAARKSDLARLQAYLVGDALAALGAKVEYVFRESLGDINQTDPLWKMPEKGVFTEDFFAGLTQGEFNLVVHSWKDLPTEARRETEIVATLPRADLRDVLIFPKQFQSRVRSTQKLKVLSSSPRREYNLRPFLGLVWPHSLQEIEFSPVRGNVQTRVRKCLQGEGDALIVAKAALDRLLSATRDEFQTTRLFLRQALDQCQWMVLPITVDPPAAAQGALAIEIAKTAGPEIRSLLAQINCKKTFSAVQWERQTLASFGGGCHQKIGVAEKSIARGKIQVVRGLAPNGDKLLNTEFFPQGIRRSKANFGEVKIWSEKIAGAKVFTEVPISNPEIINALGKTQGIYVSKAIALPKNYVTTEGQIVWCAGLKSWQKLSAQGIWVSGCDESMGEGSPDIAALCGRPLSWLKLTHTEGLPSLPMLATYQLQQNPLSKLLPQDLAPFTHFFWTSFSQFQYYCQHFPEIRKSCHASGPGHTAQLIEKKLSQVEVFLDEEDWRRYYS